MLPGWHPQGSVRRGQDATVASRTLAWITKATGRSIVGLHPIRSGSTSIHRVEFAPAAVLPTSLALRRYLDQERLASDPWYLPSNEAAALVLLDAWDVHAPRLVAEDAGGTNAGGAGAFDHLYRGSAAYPPTLPHLDSAAGT